MVSIRFTADVLDEHDLPDMPYPVREEAMKASVEKQGELPWAEVLYGLQATLSQGRSPWQRLQPAMATLASLIAPKDELVLVASQGDSWRLEIGQVDLNDEIVTIQRGDELLCAITNRGDGKLLISGYRPLDAKSIHYLLTLAGKPTDDGKINGYENNWMFAEYAAGAQDNETAAKAGEAYLAYWGKGLGQTADGKALPVWYQQAKLSVRRASEVAAELGVYYQLQESGKG